MTRYGRDTFVIASLTVICWSPLLWAIGAAVGIW